MTRLHDLYRQHGQSPWIDNLSRLALRDGELQGLVDRGIRGVTSNPTIFQKAMSGSDAYDEQFRSLVDRGSVEDAFWDMAVDDVTDACAVLRPVHDEAGGADGFVSLEVNPLLANDTDRTIAAARSLHERLARPNLMVKIPATAEGVPAIRAMIAEGRNINVTLIFSLERYAAVIEAYLSGLEAAAEAGRDLSGVHSVASFFVSRVDTEVDRRLQQRDAPKELFGTAAVAQAQLAYQLFLGEFAGPRWEALAARGAHVQRPLWASTSTKNQAYPDLLYVDSLIGPDTVNTMPGATVEAFLQHGELARTVDADPDLARSHFEQLGEAGIDMDDVSKVLEEEGVAAFTKSYDELLQSLTDKANAMPASGGGGGR